MDKKATISSVKNQDERVIQRIYKEFKPKFENWLKGRYKIADTEAAAEIYQRSFTVLFFKIKRGQLNDLEASLETYLFGVGKMVLLEWWREQGNRKELVNPETDLEIGSIESFSTLFEGDAVADDLRRKLAKHIEEMGDPCKTILKLFYWERNSMEAIALKTGYKNEQGAKKKKYLCLKKLKELMNA